MSDEQISLALPTAIRAARAGGELALARLGEPGYLKWKGNRDVVAGAVFDIQACIVDAIRQSFPDAHMLLEESDTPQDVQADPLWIIDPIDGTLNFNQGIPFFAIAIAYRLAGEVQVGVVYDPTRNELYHAVLGQGAFLNDRPINVSKFSEGQEAYQQALVATDLPGGLQDRKTALYVNRILGNEVVQLWTMGSPALALCYLAAGRLHAYFAMKLQVWDVAAASVILHEAGGVLTDIDGGSWLYSDGGYLATNGVIHGAMLRTIKPLLEMQHTPKGQSIL